MSTIQVSISYKGVHLDDTQGGVRDEGGPYRVAVPINPDTSLRDGFRDFIDAVEFLLPSISNFNVDVGNAVLDEVDRYVESMDRLLPQGGTPEVQEGIWEEATEREEAPSMIFEIEISGHEECLRKDFEEALTAMAPDSVVDLLGVDEAMGELLRAWNAWEKRVVETGRYHCLPKRKEVSMAVLRGMIRQAKDQSRSSV